MLLPSTVSMFLTPTSPKRSIPSRQEQKGSEAMVKTKIYRTALYTEQLYIQNSFISRTALYTEQLYIQNSFIYRTALYTEQLYK
jgi:hypothetical protein